MQEPIAATPLDGRLAKIEASLQSLQELRELSEILSVKYNPFLSLEESGSEDGNDARLLLRRQVHGRSVREDPELDDILRPSQTPLIAGKDTARVVSDVPGVPDMTVGHDSRASQAAADRMGEDPSERSPPASSGASPDTHPSPPPGSGESQETSPLPTPRVGTFGRQTAHAPGTHSDRALFHARGPGVGGPREAFLAMNWFTFLSEGTDSSIIFQYLDYYRYTGWIDDENHAWLYRLAEGVATPKASATWGDYGMDAKRLAERHLRNLRFLDKLLGTTLQHGEADYLQQTLDMLLDE